MDKGIFYLVCSVLIIAAVVFSGVFTTRNVKNLCAGKVSVEKVVVVATPTVEPTATPAAVFKRLPLAAPTKAVK